MAPWMRFLMLGLLTAGCAAVDTRQVAEQLTNARVAVEAAEKEDASRHAQEVMRRAQDALAIAKDAYANQAYSRAFDFAKQATLYGRVAKAKTEQVLAEQRLAGLKEQLEKTRAQTGAMMQSPDAPVQVTVSAQTVTTIPTVVIPPAVEPVVSATGVSTTAKGSQP